MAYCFIFKQVNKAIRLERTSEAKMLVTSMSENLLLLLLQLTTFCLNIFMYHFYLFVSVQTLLITQKLSSLPMMFIILKYSVTIILLCLYFPKLGSFFNYRIETNSYFSIPLTLLFTHSS